MWERTRNWYEDDFKLETLESQVMQEKPPDSFPSLTEISDFREAGIDSLVRVRLLLGRRSRVRPPSTPLLGKVTATQRTERPLTAG